MAKTRTSTSLLLAALAIGGSSLAFTSQASAFHLPGPRVGVWHPVHPGWVGHYGPRWGHWGGGHRCRLVRRIDAWGDIRVRRVCFSPY